MDDDITVFICEDKDTACEIITKYMIPKRVTYAALFNADQREAITTVLDGIEEGCETISDD